MLRTFLALLVLVGSSNIANAEGPPLDAPDAISTGERGIRVSVLVDAPAQAVYEAWSTGAGFERVVDRPATIEARVGGKFEIQWVPDAPEGERGSEGCTVLAYVPDRMIAFTWNAPPEFGPLRDEHTHVVVELDEVAPELTRMTLTQLGWGEGEAWDELYAYFGRAWPSVCNAIKAHFEGTPEEKMRYRQAWAYLFVELVRPDLIQTMTEDEKRILGEHFEYLKGLTERGQIVFAGPCTDIESDNPGPGIVMLYAGSEAEARAVMENDPAVRAGIFKAELHPLAMSLLRERDWVRP